MLHNDLISDWIRPWPGWFLGKACVVSGKAEVARYAKMDVGKPLALKDQSQDSLWLLAKDKRLRALLLKQLQEHCRSSDGQIARDHMAEQPASVSLESSCGFEVESEAFDVWPAAS